MWFSSLQLRNKPYWIFLAILALIAMIFGGLATAKYGAGVASDSTKYLSVAQSLMDGKGLFDHRGFPLLSWPPLYSIVLAGLSLLSRQDVFLVAWYLNVFLLGLNLLLSGVLFYRVFSEKLLYAYLANLFILLSLPSLRIHSVVSSDPLYLTMVLIFLLSVKSYIIERSTLAFAGMVVLSALAPLQRYVGPSIGVTAGIIILVENRNSPRIFWRDGFVLGLISILPIAWWLGIHNIMTYGTLWGIEQPPVDVFMNAKLGLIKILHWFIPYLSFLMPALTRPFILLGLLVLVIYFVNRRNGEGIRAWMQALGAPSTYPILVHGIIYFLAVTLTIVTGDHRDLFSDRYYFILLVPVLIFLFITYDRLVRPHLHLTARQAEYALVLFFMLWAIYPLYSMREYLVEASVQGEPSSYNIFNNRVYHEMDLIHEVQKLRRDEPQAIVYSNYVDAVWFYTRKPVSLLPLVETPNPEETYQGWPQSGPGYIVWLEPNEYKHYMSPEQIQAFADLKLVFQGKGGKIFYVQPR